MLGEMGENRIISAQLHSPYSVPVTYRQAAKEILKLAGPSTVALLIHTGATFVSVKILSDLGDDQLAASGLSASVQNLLITPTSAMLESVCILIGAEKGKNNDVEIGKLYRQGLLLAALVSVPLVIVTQFMEPILIGLNQPRNLARISQNFFHTFVYGIPFTFFQTVNEQAAMGLKKPSLFAVSTLCKIALSAGLSYALIPGNFGLPALKEQGFGLALASGPIVSFAGTMLYLKCSKTFQPYQLFSCDFRQGIDQLKRLVRRSLPILVRSGLETASLSVPIIFVGWLGQDPLAAQQAVVAYFYMFSIPTFVVNQTIVGLVAPQVSKVLGSEVTTEEKSLIRSNIQRYGNTATALCLVSASMGFLLFATANRPLTSAFVDMDIPKNDNIISLAKALFFVHGAELLPDAVRYVTTGMLKSFDDVDYPALITALTTAVCLGLGYVLGFPANLGVSGIYIGRDVAIATGALLLYRRLRNTYYDERNLLLHRPKEISSESSQASVGRPVNYDSFFVSSSGKGSKTSEVEQYRRPLLQEETKGVGSVESEARDDVLASRSKKSFCPKLSRCVIL